MNKLDKVLDEAMELSLEEKEILIQILKQRIIENRREKMALDAQISLKEFRQGNIKLLTAEEAIQDLREYLQNPDQENA
ncbi:hypothetical protein [Geminocystis sp.]|uniref:hypothetical protein n=1 Tax=Geminocystis sp. TaxID=2664100 RepID=UPI00359314B3